MLSGGKGKCELASGGCVCDGGRPGASLRSAGGGRELAELNMAKRKGAVRPVEPVEPVGVEALKDALLHMIVEKFDGRPLDWETVERALSLVNFEVKQAAVFSRQ